MLHQTPTAQLCIVLFVHCCCVQLCVTFKLLKGSIEGMPVAAPAGKDQLTLVGVRQLYISVAAKHGAKPVRLEADVPTGALQEAYGSPPKTGGCVLGVVDLLNLHLRC